MILYACHCFHYKSQAPFYNNKRKMDFIIFIVILKQKKEYIGKLIAADILLMLQNIRFKPDTYYFIV